jgi:phytol kinase
MIGLIIALAGVAGLIVIGEYLRRVHLFQTEVTRKFIHISVAIFAASWPFFLEWNQIYLISMLMLAGNVFSRLLGIFSAIHGVQRRTWGEIFYAVGIGMTAILSQNKWSFAAAMLVMGLSDGLAALVGTLIDDVRRYKILGHTKSVAGTMTFFFTTLIVLFFCASIGHLTAGVAVLFGLAVAATLVENVSFGGTDNLLVPLLIVFILT